MINYPIFPAVLNYPTEITPTRLDKVEKAQTDGGYVQTRLKSTRAMFKYELSYNALVDTLVKQLQEFDKLTGYGSKPFYYTLPDRWNDNVAKLVRIDGEISYKRISRRHFSVSLILQEV